MQLYNTLHRQKEDFIPLDDNIVNIYVCGITAYDLCHIGHARSAVVFDVLVRFLRQSGYQVFFVRNFTDVDDKIINKANKTGVSCEEIAAKYIAAFHEDMDALGVLRADVEPRATEYIDEMLNLTATLIDGGHAYVTGKGDVYFRVRSFKNYGQLSGRHLEELMSGARIAPDEDKEDPLDFALWKAAKPGEPSWKSPWGAGRPGWHIECSAMSEKYLGIPFDIHGGGQDLIFPHHENELAQSEACTDRIMARYWLHNGFVQINSEKMSKSLGNFMTIRDILQLFHPEVIRLFLLTKHYRSPIDFTLEAMEEAEKNLKKVYETLSRMQKENSDNKWKAGPFPSGPEAEFKQLTDDWRNSLEDDLNTAAALGQIFGMTRLANRLYEDKSLRRNETTRALYRSIVQELEDFSRVTSLFGLEPSSMLSELRKRKAARRGVEEDLVTDLLNERALARREKDFAKSDAIRQKLLDMHVEVQDTPDGQVWDVI